MDKTAPSVSVLDKSCLKVRSVEIKGVVPELHYRTTDGKLFEQLINAEAHQKKINQGICYERR